jgi:hypothetical protein
VKKNILATALVAFSIFFIYSSCTKLDTTDIGNELIPAVDNVNTFETVLDIITDNLRSLDDTSEMQYNLDHAVGIIENDPDFGRTDAALYFDVAPSTFKVYPFIKKDSIVAVDSVVVSLAYRSLYGDSNSVQRIEVFEVTPAADFKYSNTSDYRLNHPDFPVLPTPLGGRTVDFKALNDSVRYINGKDTVRTVNELRIPVNSSFATRFINADTSNAYRNDSIFKTYFKGFSVKVNNATSPSKNALAYFDLAGEKTRVTFYFRVRNNGKDSAVTSFFRYFSSNGSSSSSIGAQANLIKRAPGNGYLANLNNGNPNDPKLYIQTTPGSYASLKIPGIDTLSNRVIHRAEIIVEKLNPISDAFATPDLLFIDMISNAAGDSSFIIPKDFAITGTGTYDINSIGGRLKNNKYVFNISRHLQEIVTNKRPNYMFRIYAPFIASPYAPSPRTGRLEQTPFLVNPLVAKGRVIVGGGSHPTNKMRLRIIYSRI